ncbi:MAG TPA: carboxypeptidase-like regulatory domain-containing protein [Longimicrobiales bacterium]|nr:carboxypeptidase-like regulatory domain-containing protein [Longimicrobiales bacterium]
MKLPALRRTLYALLSTLVIATQAFAQNKISGKVIDPQNKPVGNIAVFLHGVSGSAGNEVAHDTSSADGSFELSLPTVDPNLVYFVAVVWNGQLYIGEMLKAPFPTTKDYVVQVGVNPVDLGGQQDEQPVAPEVQEKDRSAGIAVIVAAIALIALIASIALSRRPPARRRMLVQLARLENEIDANPSDAETLQKRRAELRARLRSAKTG